MNNDDSPTEFILEEDSIKIVNDVNFNSLYYRAILERHKNSPIISVTFKGETGFQISRNFPIDITIKEMIKIFIFEMKIPKDEIFLYEFHLNCERLKFDDNKLLKERIMSGNVIKFLKKSSFISYQAGPGKIFIIHIENDEREIFELETGTLSQIKNIYNLIKMILKNMDLKLIGNPILYPGEIELKDDDERTFSSIGIRDECIVYVKCSKL